MNTSSIESIDSSILTPIVRKSLDRDSFRVQEWHVSHPGTGVGNPVSLGIYRFEGTGQDQDEQLPWSIILKVIQSPANVGQENLGEGADQTHWNYWKREPLIYGSDLLESLPGGLTAPRCFGIVDLPGNIVWLWLEDIIGSNATAWSLDRYALAARHLGQFNGSYLSERSLPSFPWLSQHRIQQWIEQVPWQTIPWEHPLVLKHYPRLEKNSFQHLLSEHQRFLAKLRQLPQTLCHGDTYPTNLMSRDLSAGQQHTVALDWALAGIAPVGSDLGQLVFGAQKNLKEINPDVVSNSIFENYIDGLRDSGFTVEPQLVRFGYTAYAALQVGLFAVYLLAEEIAQSETIVEPVDVQSADPDCFEVIMAKEAYKVLDII